jgi:flavorubredoxin
MFTYSALDKVVFTCDFLGTHYCEPYIYDCKINPKHLNAYLIEAKNYYDAIFSPFADHVVYGIKQLEKLSIDYACVSHGPILNKNCQLPTIMKLYKE